jgi:hypothetical protein
MGGIVMVTAGTIVVRNAQGQYNVGHKAVIVDGIATSSQTYEVRFIGGLRDGEKDYWSPQYFDIVKESKPTWEV